MTFCRKSECVRLAGGPGLVAHTVAECRVRPASWCRRAICLDIEMGQTSHRTGECGRRGPGGPETHELTP